MVLHEYISYCPAPYSLAPSTGLLATPQPGKAYCSHGDFRQAASSLLALLLQKSLSKSFIYFNVMFLVSPSLSGIFETARQHSHSTLPMPLTLLRLLPKHSPVSTSIQFAYNDYCLPTSMQAWPGQWFCLSSIHVSWVPRTVLAHGKHPTNICWVNTRREKHGHHH